MSKVTVMSDSLGAYGIVHGILQGRILEWVAVPFSRGSSQPRHQTQVSHSAGGFFTSWATRECSYSLGNYVLKYFISRLYYILPCLLWASQVALVVMNLHANAQDVKRNGFDPWVGTHSWRRTWQPTQYFCLDTPMDRRAWGATVHRVTKSQTWLERLSTCVFSSHLNTYEIGNWWISSKTNIPFPDSRSCGL